MAAKRTASRAKPEGDGSRQSGSGKATKRSTGSSAASKTSTKAAAQQASARKAPAKQAPAKKASARKSAAKKAPTSSSGRSTTRATARTKAATAPPKATKGAAKPATPSTPGKATTRKVTAKKTATKKAAKSASAPRTGTVKLTAAKARSLPVLDGEEPWTTAELAEVKDELAADVAKLQSEIDLAEEGIAGLMQDAGDQSGDDEADAGAKTFEREQEISLANNSRDLLDQSRHALERIEDGTYGTCESCRNPIGKLRLQAFPRATLCMTCKRKQERR